MLSINTGAMVFVIPSVVEVNEQFFVIKNWLKEHAEKSFFIDPHYHPTLKDIRHRIAMKLEKFFNIELSKKHFHLIRTNSPENN